MKVILTGATGFIGGEVLNQALANPRITSLICLTRKPLPGSASNNAKVKVITLADFSSYPPEVLSELKGAQGCIWAMGSPAHKNPDLEACRKVEIGYTRAAVEAFAASLAPSPEDGGKSFRFVYLSGMLANRDPSKTMWFMHNTRTLKGKAENGILEVQKQAAGRIDVSIVRPGGVLVKGTSLPRFLFGVTMSIKVDELAAAMIGEVVGETNGTRMLDNDALRNRGRVLLMGEGI